MPLLTQESYAVIHRAGDKLVLQNDRGDTVTIEMASRHDHTETQITVFACRVGDRRAITLPRRASNFRIAGRRWLSLTADDQAEVIDMRTRRVVTKALKGARRTLLPDGTLIVNDAAGTLTARAPGAAQATTLQATGATALATAGSTVYWTAGGAAHSSTARA